MGSVRTGNLNGTFDGEGAKRKETSKDRQQKRYSEQNGVAAKLCEGSDLERERNRKTQAKTDTNKNLEAERKSERGCRVNHKRP